MGIVGYFQRLRAEYKKNLRGDRMARFVREMDFWRDQRARVETKLEKELDLIDSRIAALESAWCDLEDERHAEYLQERRCA